MDRETNQEIRSRNRRPGKQTGSEYGGIEGVWRKVLSALGAGESGEGSSVRTVNRSNSQIARHSDMVRADILYRVRIKEREHESLNMKISEICENGRQDLTPEFAFGDVDVIKVHPKVPIKIAEGWHSTMVYKDGSIDRYSVTFEEGSILDWHSHIQVEVVTVTSGSLKVLIVDKKYPNNKQDMDKHITVKRLERGQMLMIPSQHMHKIVANETGVCYVSFEPPLSADDNPLPEAGDE